MSFFIIGAIVIICGLLLLKTFMTASPRAIINGLSYIGVVILGLGGIIATILGRIGFGSMMLAGAAGLYGKMRQRGTLSSGGKQASTVRTALLEMELDHDTGEMDGLILTGNYEGKMLSVLDEAQLVELLIEAQSDQESVDLIEVYLDRQFAGWRDSADMGAGEGHGATPRSGPMTKQEAYEILGLEAGASAADIRKAHRRLMQRVHPDVGGSQALAARINSAKDVLLTGHE